MKFDQIVKHFGSQAKAAQAIGCTQPTLSNWKSRGKIPDMQQIRLQIASGGKLKSDVLAHMKSIPSRL